MTSSNENIFRVTGHLCGEFTGLRWIPAQRPVTRSFDVFYDLRPNKRLSKHGEAGDLRRFLAHYDVIVMTYVLIWLGYNLHGVCIHCVIILLSSGICVCYFECVNFKHNWVIHILSELCPWDNARGILRISSHHWFRQSLNTWRKVWYISISWSLKMKHFICTFAFNDVQSEKTHIDEHLCLLFKMVHH